MTDTGEAEKEPENKKVPQLSKAEQRLASNSSLDDASTKEAQLFNTGASSKELRKSAEEKESQRAELFRDNFEWASIVGLWFLLLLFSTFTFVWAHDLVVKEKHRWSDAKNDDKIQIIITSGFVAGLASAHIKKRLGS